MSLHPLDNCGALHPRSAAALLELAAGQGISEERLLGHAQPGVSQASWRSCENRHWSPEQYSHLYRQVLVLLQDERAGSSGRKITPGAFRMLCLAIIHCKNLSGALQRANQFFRVFYDVQAVLSVQPDGGLATVAYGNGAAQDNSHRAIQMEAYALFMWLRFLAWLTGRSLLLQQVRLQGREPQRQSFEKLFDCQVSFGCAATSVSFDSRCLDWPLIQTEQSLQSFLETGPYQLMAGRSTPADPGLGSRVRALMGEDFSRGLPSAEWIAAKLGVSVSTLRRRLQHEGTSFQALKDACRKDAAMACLRRPELPLSVVAGMTGFSETSAFHRSFKKWTGVTPGEFRRSLDLNSSPGR